MTGSAGCSEHRCCPLHKGKLCREKLFGSADHLYCIQKQSGSGAGKSLTECWLLLASTGRPGSDSCFTARLRLGSPKFPSKYNSPVFFAGGERCSAESFPWQNVISQCLLSLILHDYPKSIMNVNLWYAKSNEETQKSPTATPTKQTSNVP